MGEGFYTPSARPARAIGSIATTITRWLVGRRLHGEDRRSAVVLQLLAILLLIDVPLTVMVKCAAPSAFFGLIEQIYADQEALLGRAEQGNAQAQAASNLPPGQRMVALADAFGLTDWFAARGVSVDQSHACLANQAAAQQVAEQGVKWGNEGINSTPTLVLNGTKLKSATWGPNTTAEGTDPGLEAALQAAGAR